ncbi:MAG: hypothetical protein A3H97_20325 [Acidobacteria bacterium RIFCSPLOWO2_02_FULL_65_29]|nr:MAG: hypothetical protein A3H97_20325 [Acidobacteria bacterium RIFCSPLOWO2_02_FULL_65_29]
MKTTPTVTTTTTKLDRPDDRVPSAALLDTWSAHAWADGVLVNRLLAFDHLTVRTQNSTYEFIVIAPECAEVLVRGGAFFPDFARARVAGSSLGGSFLKLHGIYPGFRMEISDGARVIVTSPVDRLEKVESGANGKGGPPDRLM